MDINEPIVMSDNSLFCEVDNTLALAFLHDAFKAVKPAGTDNPRDLQASVIKSMLVFHHHREQCEDCGEV